MENASAGRCPLDRFAAGQAVVAAATSEPAAEARAQERLLVCQNCPGHWLQRMQPNGRYVNCLAAPRCCAGRAGEISLAYGSCPKRYW